MPEVIAAVERVNGLRVPSRTAPCWPGDLPVLVPSSARIGVETGWATIPPD